MKLTLFITFLATCALYAQDKLPVHKWTTTVSVVLEGDDEDTNRKIDSYIKRELRSLNDVTIAEQNGDYIIDVLAIKLTNNRQVMTGYAVSFVLNERAITSSNNLSFISDTNYATVASMFLSSAVFPRDHQLRTCPPEELKQTCEELVTSMDSGTFETARRNQKLIDETLSQFRNKNITNSDAVSPLPTNSIPAAASPLHLPKQSQ